MYFELTKMGCSHIISAGRGGGLETIKIDCHNMWRLKNWWVDLSTFPLKTETPADIIQAQHGKYISGAWNWAQMGETELQNVNFYTELFFQHNLYQKKSV